jgi:hypothetical protein
VDRRLKEDGGPEIKGGKKGSGRNSKKRMVMMMMMGQMNLKNVIIIHSCSEQVIWLQLFICSPFPSSFNG